MAHKIDGIDRSCTTQNPNEELSNIHIVDDISEKLSEMEDCPSEFINIVNDNFWNLV